MDLAERLSALGPAVSVTVSVGEMEPEDHETIKEVDGLGQSGVVFSILSGPGDADATALWIEAQQTMQQTESLVADESRNLEVTIYDAFRQTRLGRICSGVLSLGKVAAVALVDGGVEQVFEGALERCLRQMASDVCRPWDQAPNRLYVRR